MRLHYVYNFAFLSVYMRTISFTNISALKLHKCCVSFLFHLLNLHDHTVIIKDKIKHFKNKK
jgi:hypothetical protein